MDVRLAVLADYASVDKMGKLSVNGIFGVIHASAAPAIHPVLYLAFQVVFPTEETGRSREIQLTLRDADARTLINMSGGLEIPTPLQGEPALFSQIIRFGPLRFERFGRYEFIIQIGDNPEIVIPLTVAPIPPGMSLGV